MIIHNVETEAQHFFNSAKKWTRRHYALVRRDDLSIFRSRFAVLADSLTKTNFQERTFSRNYKTRFCRHLSRWSHRRSIIMLEKSGHINCYSRHVTYTRHLEHSRPVMMQVLKYARKNKIAAQVAQFALLIAFDGERADRWTVRQVRSKLRIDTHAAARLLRWYRQNKDDLSPATVRELIFYSTRPQWQRYAGKRPEDRPGRVLNETADRARGRSRGVPPAKRPAGIMPKTRKNRVFPAWLFSCYDFAPKKTAAIKEFISKITSTGKRQKSPGFSRRYPESLSRFVAQSVPGARNWILCGSLPFADTPCMERKNGLFDRKKHANEVDSSKTTIPAIYSPEEIENMEIRDILKASLPVEIQKNFF